MAEVQWDQVKGWQDYWEWAKRAWLSGDITTAQYEAVAAHCRQQIAALTTPAP